MNDITYSKKNEEIECVHYNNSTRSYKPHTHAGHLTVGYVESGTVCIVIGQDNLICRAGDEFRIEPNVLHEVKTIENQPYSMLVLCIKTATDYNDKLLKELQNNILENPENMYLIEEMAKDAGISPYHMIRKFKHAFGLTPHQFQIQSKVRKAQKLLEEDKSILEVTYEAGFCDQSHLDRCFQKVLGMKPTEYKASLAKGREKLGE